MKSGSDPLDDIVSHQYERYSYPPPVHDLERWSQQNWQWYDPRHASRVLWPDRDYRPDLNILVAGCGTSQAAALAFSNPQARVLGVDVSQASLNHQQYLKEKHGLGNLELRRLPLEELPSLGRDFDLIVCTGVLMVVADPVAGLSALGEVLRPDGVMGLMLYAKYGRVGVEMMQSFFRDLGLRQDDASITRVRETLAVLPADHPVRGYIGLDGTTDLAFDSGVVDTFLHGREHSHTVDDVLRLVESAGLRFQDWFFKSPYHPNELTTPHNTVFAEIGAMPGRRQWPLMERIYTRNGCHFFMACRPERPEQSYRIDFRGADAREYVPLMRMRCGLAGNRVSRPGWVFDLNATQRPFVERIDGRQTIGQIAAAVARETGSTDYAGEVERFALRFFEGLWRRDVLAVALDPAAG